MLFNVPAIVLTLVAAVNAQQPVNQISDGQLQNSAASSSLSSTQQPVAQISDGQLQNLASSSASYHQIQSDSTVSSTSRNGVSTTQSSSLTAPFRNATRTTTILQSSSAPIITTTPAALYTVAPYLTNVPLTTITRTETFYIESYTFTQTYPFVVPASYAAPASTYQYAPTTVTVTEQVLSCPTGINAGYSTTTTFYPSTAAASVPAVSQNAGSSFAGSTTTITKTLVSTNVVTSTSVNAAGSTAISLSTSYTTSTTTQTAVIQTTKLSTSTATATASYTNPAGVVTSTIYTYTTICPVAETSYITAPTASTQTVTVVLTSTSVVPSTTVQTNGQTLTLYSPTTIVVTTTQTQVVQTTKQLTSTVIVTVTTTATDSSVLTNVYTYTTVSPVTETSVVTSTSTLANASSSTSIASTIAGTGSLSNEVTTPAASSTNTAVENSSSGNVSSNTMSNISSPSSMTRSMVYTNSSSIPPVTNGAIPTGDASSSLSSSISTALSSTATTIVSSTKSSTSSSVAPNNTSSMSSSTSNDASSGTSSTIPSSTTISMTSSTSSSAFSSTSSILSSNTSNSMASSTTSSTSNTSGSTSSSISTVTNTSTSGSMISSTSNSISSSTSSVMSSSTSSTMSSVSSSTSSSTSSSASVPAATNLGTCTPVAAGAPIPMPSNGVNLLQVGSQDAPYDLDQDTLLAGISFPNGLECRNNLIILFPGTAVPALDTYTSTFIPVFADRAVADADVLVMSNPSASLGDAQTTAEYAAFAINYAALVLGRRATILPWSQGNLNTQWALKYWPSTRNNLKNYVAISPDYDGTLDASFLCNPEKLLTTNAGTLAASFLTDNGLGTSLEALLGIGALPTSAGQFQMYILALLSGNLGMYLNGTSSSTLPTSTVSTITSSTAAALITDIPIVSPLLNSTGLLPEKRRAVPFGKAELSPNEHKYWKAQIEERLAARAVHLSRQAGSGNPSALGQLLGGLLGPLAEALTSLAVQPTSLLQEILTNYAGNLGDLQIPTVLPQGCLPSVWQQVYFSNFVNVLATDYGNGRGDTVFVPTTTVFSLTDEVVQPQGATGYEAASAFLIGASNIFIQGNGGCPVVASTLISGLPSVITHEGVLYSGMGVQVAINAVKSGGTVAVDDIPANLRCALLHPLLNVQQALAQEATIPGALLRVIVGGGNQNLASDFLPAEPAIKPYATMTV